MAKLRFQVTEDHIHRGHQADPWNGPLCHAINPHIAPGVSAECRLNDVVFRHNKAASEEDGSYPAVAVAWPQEVQNLLGSHAALSYHRHPAGHEQAGRFVRDEKGRKRLVDDNPGLTEHVKPLTAEIEVPDWVVGRR